MHRIISAVLLGLLAFAADAAPETLRFYGYAYDLKTNAYLYTEVHEQRGEGERWTGGNITYLAPDGAEMGRKTLDFSQDEFVPLFKLTLNYSGYTEGISAAGRKIDMFKQASAKDPVERESVDKKPGMAADSGFHALLRARFAEMMAGKTVEFTFVVAGNLDTFRFRARKAGETRFEGRPAVLIRAEANSLLRMVAPVLELTYDPARRELLEYRGLSNIHDPRSGEPYNVRIAYYSTPPADAPKLPPLK